MVKMALFVKCEKCEQFHCVCNFKKDYPYYAKLSLQKLKEILESEQRKSADLLDEVSDIYDFVTELENYIKFREKKGGNKK